jgi:hypothetical protein
MMATNDPNSAGCKRHDGQVIDRVADHPWDELEDLCPLPARKPARNAQHGLEFCIGLAVRQEGKGTRAIRIDAELLREGTSLAN